MISKMTPYLIGQIMEFKNHHLWTAKLINKRSKIKCWWSFETGNLYELDLVEKARSLGRWTLAMLAFSSGPQINDLFKDPRAAILSSIPKFDPQKLMSCGATYGKSKYKMPPTVDRQQRCSKYTLSIVSRQQILLYSIRRFSNIFPPHRNFQIAVKCAGFKESRQVTRYTRFVFHRVPELSTKTIGQNSSSNYQHTYLKS